MTVRFAVLGAGRIGQVHARAIHWTDGAELAAVADPVTAAAEAATSRFGGTRREIDEILGSADVDALVICTPTDTHADLIEAACRAGKAVFCEKPIDLSLPRVKACLEVVRETGGTLMVAFQRRFDPDFQALKAEIDAGRIGKLEMISLTSRDPGLPPMAYIERSGGIFRDMTIHDFDVARWLLDEPVETVMAQGSVLVDAGVAERGDFDSVNVILRTGSGQQCTITNSRRAAYGYDQRIEVLGEKGSLTATNHHRSQVEAATAEGYTRPPLLDFFMDRYQAAYAAEIAHFTDCLARGVPPSPTGDDGLQALALAEAAVQSVASGRAIRVADVINP